MSKKILVTGATGNIAGAVIPALVQGGASVRAYVRDLEKASNLKELGVELAQGDFSDQAALNRAAQGVDAFLAITAPNPDAVLQGEVLLNAALNSGSPYYVRISAIGAAADAPTENGRLHHQSDEALISSGLTYTILRPHFFMQNLFASVETIKGDGNMYWGMGEGKLGMIDVRDIADCVVSLLLNGGHDNKIYTPSGPDSISFQDVARIISNGLGKPVNYVPVSLDAVREAILSLGWGEWGAQVMVQYSKAYSENWGDFVTDDVEILTGQKPRSFKNFIDEVLVHALK